MGLKLFLKDQVQNDIILNVRIINVHLHKWVISALDCQRMSVLCSKTFSCLVLTAPGGTFLVTGGDNMTINIYLLDPVHAIRNLNHCHIYPA